MSTAWPSRYVSVRALAISSYRQGDVVRVTSRQDINALLGYALELAFSPDCKKLVALSNLGIVQAWQ